MLTIRNLSILHNIDLRPLIRNLSFTLSGTERLAVIGEEGNGKSALLKAIVHPESIQSWAAISGEIHTNGERIGYLAQEAPEEWNPIPACTLCMSSPAFIDADPGQLAEICRQLSMQQDLCWSDTPFELLSGGEKVRLRLMLLLCEKPSMLLLDEPGNDLDLDAILALEHLLLSCGLPVLYVSHDEELLKRTATQVLHLESLYNRSEPRWTWVKEPYMTYVQNRRNQLDKQSQLWRNDQREQRIHQEKLRRIEDAVAHAQATISRADPHGGRLLKKKMKAVKSLEHRYERERSDAVERPWEEFSMDALFSDITPVPNGRHVLDLSLDCLAVEGKVISSEINLQIRGSEKVLKLSRDELEHPIRSLSGGQKAKVLLLKLILAHPSVLIMDEPTRNLSPLSAPVMRDVICTFPGAVLCVTHDRILIQDWPGRILHLTANGLVTVKA